MNLDSVVVNAARHGHGVCATQQHLPRCRRALLPIPTGAGTHAAAARTLSESQGPVSTVVASGLRQAERIEWHVPTCIEHAVDVSRSGIELLATITHRGTDLRTEARISYSAPPFSPPSPRSCMRTRVLR